MGLRSLDGSLLILGSRDKRGGLRFLGRPQQQLGDIDFFLVAGQSNAQGSGNSALSPTVPAGVGYKIEGATVSHLADPVGGATTGSAWPAFAIAYNAATGRKVAVVEAAVGGTGLVTTATGSNWGPNGTLADDAANIAETAIAALYGAGWTPNLRGILWHQGEWDAQNVASAGLADAYEDALSDLRTRIASALGAPALKMFVWQLGTRDQGDTAGFQAVRAGQAQAATNDPLIELVYTECVEFPARDWMSDDLHYTQDGYNDMGTDGGAVVAATRNAGWVPPYEEPEPIPGVLDTATGYIVAKDDPTYLSGSTLLDQIADNDWTIYNSGGFVAGDGLTFTGTQGTGTYLDTPDHANMQWGTGDFTILVVFKNTATEVGGTYRGMFHKQVNNFLLRKEGNLSMVAVAGGGGIVGPTATLDTIQGYAVRRTGTTATVVIDGLSGANYTRAGDVSQVGNPPTIGDWFGYRTTGRFYGAAWWKGKHLTTDELVSAKAEILAKAGVS